MGVVVVEVVVVVNMIGGGGGERATGPEGPWRGRWWWFRGW